MKTISYSTTYHIYYDFGSVVSGSFSEKTLSKLKTRMVDFSREYGYKGGGAELIEFEPIKKHITIFAAKGKFVKFKKITNLHVRGKEPNKEFYTKLIK